MKLQKQTAGKVTTQNKQLVDNNTNGKLPQPGLNGWTKKKEQVLDGGTIHVAAGLEKCHSLQGKCPESLVNWSIYFAKRQGKRCCLGQWHR